MKTRIHAIAGAIGLLMILLFWTSTVISELFGSFETIAAVKGLILNGMFILIPAMVVVGGSGTMLGAGRSEAAVRVKQKRMPIIAANGLLVLLPMAFLLEARASAGTFDIWFYFFQTVELIAGATNLTLMGLNFRDGLKLTGRTAPATQTRMLSRKIVARDTAELHLSKPDGFTFEPGQAIRLTIPTGADPEAGRMARVFSIASAPHEDDLVVITRLRDSSAYKKALGSMKEGTYLDLAGPIGDFTLDCSTHRPAVFLAGGIGITPFLSMLRAAAHTAQLNETTLIYSNRSTADAAALEALQGLDAAQSGFRLVATMTDAQSAEGWDGETGYVDAAMLGRHLSDITAPIYYCVGPGTFVTAMRDMLVSAGIDPKDIRYEQFGGY